jgi:hypothetical protein
VESLDLNRAWYAQRAASPRAYSELFRKTFGPVVAIRAGLADQPKRLAAFDRELLEFATRSNRGEPHGAAEYRYEYVLVIARKQGT